MADFTPILDYCTCKFTPIQAYLQIFPPSIFHQIPPQTKTPRIKLAFLHGVTTDVFLLNTDYTDFTDNLVLPHNGTKASSLDAPPNKNIRVIREIRVQKPYASRINKDYPRPQKNYPCNPCSEPYASRINKAIRVIRAIRVQNPYASRKYKEYPRSQKASVKSVFKPPYAPRLNKDIRVSRQKKNPCSDLPSNCLETRIVHCFVGSGQFF